MKFLRSAQKKGIRARWESIGKPDRRLILALALYGAIIVVAILELDGFLRIAVLFFISLLVIKTLAHSEQQGMGDDE